MQSGNLTLRVLALLGRVGRAGLPGAFCCAPLTFPEAALSFNFSWLPPRWGCPFVVLLFSTPRFLLFLPSPPCAPAVSCFLLFPAPGAMGLGASFLFSSCFSSRPAWLGVCFLPPSVSSSPPPPLLFCSFFCLPPLVCFVGLPLVGSSCAPFGRVVFFFWCVVLCSWLLLRVVRCLWSCRPAALFPLWCAVWFWSPLPCAVLCCVPGCNVAPRCCVSRCPALCGFVPCCVVLLVWCRCLLCCALGRCPSPCGPALWGAVFCGFPPHAVLCAVSVFPWFVAACCCSPLCFVLCVCAVCVLGCRAARSLSSLLCAVLCRTVLVRLLCAVRVVCAVCGAWCCGALLSVVLCPVVFCDAPHGLVACGCPLVPCFRVGVPVWPCGLLACGLCGSLWCPAPLCCVVWCCAVVWCCTVVLCCRFAVLFVLALLLLCAVVLCCLVVPCWWASLCVVLCCMWLCAFENIKKKK